MYLESRLYCQKGYGTPSGEKRDFDEGGKSVKARPSFAAQSKDDLDSPVQPCVTRAHEREEV